ncbi:DnaB-like helicase C-terminal domain-containing protein [Salsipaludibacter albus]|uniref:DnaB-like helicase C-terminal domain-containing protein n=1 Tax=Salsipaludibacter albus TaxID=2849650 RepID=UPI001EE3C717|nr:DnaB-like helicase C-terminal domain-containing protein [Salsipaludibacter albus]MBY5162893.1 DnaB-like helicase C-terminal domain-containing protein [Salsipaludibacter albus]
MSGHLAMPTPKTVTTLLDDLDADLRAGRASGFEPIPTGFKAFDEALGGGLRRGDLTIFSGPPGVGKTILGLQTARHVAAANHPAVVVCYEHDQTAMLLRMLAQETGVEDPRGRIISQLQERLRRGALEQQGLADVVRSEPALRHALNDLTAVGDNLVLLGGSVRETDLDALDDLVVETIESKEGVPLLIVDYLQKVPTDDHDATARSRRVVEGLKDLAMARDIPVVALASLSVAGLTARKLRLAHLDETSAIAFEADVVVLLNDKRDAVAKAHLAYGGQAAKEYENWVIWSLEKNRSGPNLVNLEFEKDFMHFRYHPEGRHVSERLADDRIGGDGG